MDIAKTATIATLALKYSLQFLRNAVRLYLTSEHLLFTLYTGFFFVELLSEAAILMFSAANAQFI